MSGKYPLFLEKYREITRLEEAGSVLAWDQETYMPRGAVNDRADQLSVISGFIHRLKTGPEYTGLVAELSNDDSLSPEQKIQMREARREMEKAAKLPTLLVEETTKAVSVGLQAWAEARRKNDFPLFRDHLARIIELKKQAGACLASPSDPYAGLLDLYEPDMTSDRLDRIFAPLKEALPGLVRRIADKKLKRRKDFYSHVFPAAAQKALCFFVAHEMGLSDDHFRMDESAHPFCTSFSRNDVRCTVRFHQNRPFQSLYAAMHECGHALYDSGFDPGLANTPCATNISLGIHESQSRMWENMIGRSLAFIETYYDKIREFLGPFVGEFSPRELYDLATEVEPSYIRVEADEVTYNLHVFLRHDLERAIFRGELKADDLPEAWNAAFERAFGLKVDCPANGVLQDIHWAMGSIGYFPTYTLGNLYAAQLKAAMEKTLGPVDALVRGRRLPEVKKWLNRNVHCFGRLKKSDELMRDATGASLDPAHFMKYLTEKYA